jgi:hypothetical protein
MTALAEHSDDLTPQPHVKETRENSSVEYKEGQVLRLQPVLFVEIRVTLNQWVLQLLRAYDSDMLEGNTRRPVPGHGEAARLTLLCTRVGDRIEGE